MLNTECEVLMEHVNEKYPFLDDDEKINIACDMMAELYVSQTFPTTVMLYEKALSYHHKNNISGKELMEFIYDSICADNRRFDIVSNNHTVQVTDNFCKYGRERIEEAKKLCEG